VGSIVTGFAAGAGVGVGEGAGVGSVSTGFVSSCFGSSAGGSTGFFTVSGTETVWLSTVAVTAASPSAPAVKLASASPPASSASRGETEPLVAAKATGISGPTGRRPPARPSELESIAARIPVIPPGARTEASGSAVSTSHGPASTGPFTVSQSELAAVGPALQPNQLFAASTVGAPARSSQASIPEAVSPAGMPSRALPRMRASLIVVVPSWVEFSTTMPGPSLSTTVDSVISIWFRVAGCSL